MSIVDEKFISMAANVLFVTYINVLSDIQTVDLIF